MSVGYRCRRKEDVMSETARGPIESTADVKAWSSP